MSRHVLSRPFTFNRSVSMLYKSMIQSRPSYRQCRRKISSNATEKELEYCNILFKRFLFQIHPDFFSNYRKERSINEANIQKLTELIGKYDTYAYLYIVTKLSYTNLICSFSHQSMGAVRTLTFYLKPMEVEETPKRVKVSILSINR